MIWKILFVIYILIYSLLSYMGITDMSNAKSIPFIEVIGNYCVEIIIILAIIYTFALGWNKKLIDEKFNKIFFKFSIFSFILIGYISFKNTYAGMYSDMLLQAMQNGMVPRHWDFQLLLAITKIEVLIFVGLVIFSIFAPFYLGYYHYSKKMSVLNIAQHSGRKCFAIYTAFSILLAYISIFMGISGDFYNFNLFDCLSILSSTYILVGLIGYAFNIEFLNQTFWRVCLPFCIIMEALPDTFFTKDFLNVTGYSAASQASPIYIIASYLITAIAIFMIYRYACTDVVFKKADINKIKDTETSESI